MSQSPELELFLERTSGIPAYLQIRDQIAAFIAAGRLPAGARLPAGRALAAQLGVNRATVDKAYARLVTDGLALAHVGRGTFVRALAEPARPVPMTWALSRAAEAVGRRRLYEQPATDYPDPIDFASLVPDEELFPIEPFQEVLQAVIARDGKALLQYGSVSGYGPLREYIAARLAERGVPVHADEVLIVNGSQQGLDLLFRTFLDPGDGVAVESPTYSAALLVLAQYQARLLDIPMTPRGLDLDTLEAVLANQTARLVYTMPTFHNPTGITMDLAARQALLELARRHRVPIVEDDFEAELRYGGRELPPLKGLDEGGLVLYVGTFSKGLFPGLRLGWIVAPRAVMGPLSRMKMFSDHHSSPLLQAAVLEFCLRGHYDAHLDRLARIHRRKSRLLVQAMTRYFPPEVTWTEPEGGYAFWVTLPERLSSGDLLSECARRGVLFTPGDRFFAGEGGERFLRLSISRVPAARIDQGIRLLADAMHQLRSAAGEGPALRPDHSPVFPI